MKRFFCSLFGGKKNKGSDLPVTVQVSLVAERTYFRTSNRHWRYLDSWYRPTFLPLTLDVSSEQYWKDLEALQFAAKMLVWNCESWPGRDFETSRSRVLAHHAEDKVLFKVWPSATFVDPESAEFFETVCFASESGQPIEIFCKWENDDLCHRFEERLTPTTEMLRRRLQKDQ